MLAMLVHRLRRCSNIAPPLGKQRRYMRVWLEGVSSLQAVVYRVYYHDYPSII